MLKITNCFYSDNICKQRQTKVTLFHLIALSEERHRPGTSSMSGTPDSDDRPSIV